VEMTPDKSKIKTVIKIILLILVFILINIIVLNVYYKITRENIEKYISNDFNGFIKLGSLLDFYEQINGQRVNKIFLTNPKFESIYKIVGELKEDRYAKNKPLRYIINNDADIIIRKNNSIVLLLDLGFKSVFFNAAKFLSKYFKRNEFFQIQVVKNKDFTLYKIYFYKINETMYFSIFENLIFAGFNKEDIEFIYNSKNKKNNILTDKVYLSVKGKMHKSGTIEVYFDSDRLLNTLLKNNQESLKLFNEISYENKSALNFNISAEKFYFNIYSKLLKNENSAVAFEVKSPDAFKLLPDNTMIVKTVNINSLENYLKSILRKEVFNNSKKIIDEKLSTWTGNETGIFNTENNSSSIYYIKVKNKNKFDENIRKMQIGDEGKKTNVLLKEEIKTGRIIISPELYYIFSEYFNGRILFYALINDFAFFSESSSGIRSLIESYNGKNFLKDDKVFKDLISRVRDKTDIFIYFNLTKNIPGFLKNRNFISDIIKLYEKGVVSLKIEESFMELESAGFGMNQRKVSFFPGYPKKIYYQVTSPVICESIDGSPNVELVYATSDAKLHITDFNNKELDGFPVKLNGILRNSPLITDLNNNGRNEIYLLTENGFFYSLSVFGKEIAPIIKSDFKNTYNPLRFTDRFLFYSRKEKKFYYLRGANFIESPFKPLNNSGYSPVVLEDLLIISQKNSLTAFNANGNISKGFPVILPSYSPGSPLISRLGWDNFDSIIFVSQNGELNAWDKEGRSKDGFPVMLNGVFYNQPEAGVLKRGDARSIAALDIDGVLRIVNHKGKVTAEKKIKEAASKESRIILFDVNGDNTSEIFIYGANNKIYAFDSSLNVLSGFPVSGSSKPVFSDFNFDNEYEMVTVSTDNSINIYTIPRF